MLRLLRGTCGAFGAVIVVSSLCALLFGGFFVDLVSNKLMWLAIPVVFGVLTRVLENETWTYPAYMIINGCLGLMISIVIGALIIGSAPLASPAGLIIVALATTYGVVLGITAGVGYRFVAGNS
jgi:hypothetical protein